MFGRRSRPRPELITKVDQLRDEILDGDWFQTGYVLGELDRIANGRTSEPKRRAAEAALQMRAAMVTLQAQLVGTIRTEQLAAQLTRATWALVVATLGLLVVTLVR